MRLIVLPKVLVRITEANVKYAELSGKVIVGEQSAARLTKQLSREVLPGEVFDLGTLAVFHKNPLKRFIANLKIAAHNRRSPFRESKVN